MSRVALDSWAVLALLNDEAAAGRVEQAVERGDAVMSWVNLGEVYYQTIRRRDERRARIAVESIARRVRVEEPDAELVLAAARVKARGRMAYADAFCIATARRHRATLYTGDPEILDLAGDDLDVVDLRTAP
jgi:PIN domain nuclease of toxin-antitoxin system